MFPFAVCFVYGDYPERTQKRALCFQEADSMFELG